ncbi:hypothetical protein A5768_26225 [Mycolicibacterium fortuitum]|uniref:hypothetical protein n=1 Tax=Mycolicibacterium fortuitum TaxID=1766 RepID=UPI0007EB7A80|nr:hypothetical protein [Mycolicibacterium fortuitum]OBG21600.1 hypothetical protein A5768_26225 [Mycolicibacterium fortuitum]
MTVEYYDLAQRLYAARSGQPVLRVAGALFELSPTAIVAEVATDAAGTLTADIAVANGQPRRVNGDDVLRALRDAGAGFDDDPAAQPLPQLVITDGRALGLLAAAARAARNRPDVAAAAAVVGWWADRTGYPGSGAVVALMSHSRQRYITGALPSVERRSEHWRATFGVAAGIRGVWPWAQRLASGPLLDMLADAHEDDRYSFTVAANRFASGADWAAKDRAPVAAMGLRRRCDAAELWEAALRSDRLWRQRATHTGHVSGGEVVASTAGTFTVACNRLDTRLRDGSEITGWQGGLDNYDRAVRFEGEINKAAVVKGALWLTISRVRADLRPHVGDWASLMPAPPQQSTVRSRRNRYGRLQFGTDSWIASGRTPGLTRRDVPLDVLIAAADDE